MIETFGFFYKKLDFIIFHMSGVTWLLNNHVICYNYYMNGPI